MQVTEITGFDEAGASVVALVAEDAIHFQWVADGLMDLQHHLVWHQQQVTLAAGCVGRQQQLQRLVGHTLSSTDQAAAFDDFEATLLAEVVPAQATALAVLAVAGGDTQPREQEPLSMAPSSWLKNGGSATLRRTESAWWDCFTWRSENNSAVLRSVAKRWRSRALESNMENLRVHGGSP
ncbi:hypothetical protein D3C73_1134920 [compost metagenome]